MSTTERQPMSLLDATSLRIETPESPMHVASLEIFRIPDGAGPGFVREIVEAFRAPGPLSKPFGLALADGPLSRITPSLVAAAGVDLEDHVRHSALPATRTAPKARTTTTRTRPLTGVSA